MESQLGVVDTVVMVAFVLATLAIGVFYGVRDRGGEKLLLSRNMNVLPVALSIMATFMSAILIVGTPSEIFYFGLYWLVAVLTFPVAACVAAFVFLPIFYRLGLTSVYEYLGLRFGGRWMNMLATLAFMVQSLLYTAVVLVAPAIVLSSVTGLGSGLAMALIGVLGTLYTAFGGFRAVIWADVLQAVVMFTGIIAIIVKGSINAGGFASMLDINRQHGRLTTYDFSVDPFQRTNFFNTFFGQVVMWSSLFGVNQPSIQRLISLPTYNKAAITMLLGSALICLIATLASTSGLAVFATYAACDPLAAGSISRRDQVVPYFVAQQFGDVPGLAGLFLACVLSGALSTVSSALNSLAAVAWEDFLKPSAAAAALTAHNKAWVLRALACGFGVVTIAMAFLAENMGSVIQVAISVYGGVSGPLLGVFCLAVFATFSNPIGCTAGLVVGLVLALWASFGAAFSDLPPPAMLPTQVYGCLPQNGTAAANATFLSSFPADGRAVGGAPRQPHSDMSVLESFYSLSYFLISVLGFLTTVVVGAIVSCATGGSRVVVDPEHVSPLVRWTLTRHAHKSQQDASEGKNNTALQMEEMKLNGHT